MIRTSEADYNVGKRDTAEGADSQLVNLLNMTKGDKRKKWNVKNLFH